jgi:hypothetical protein
MWIFATDSATKHKGNIQTLHLKIKINAESFLEDTCVNPVVPDQSINFNIRK